ncbi:probable methyltransferase TCM_000336 isoform X2 [Salvia miltiorrhiza]|nr:probable methyltransferase TCM_000336 isoform X2 [Salvia miltiorrhiza]
METRPKSMGIADMGCSSGPNTLSNVKEFIGAVEEACRKMKEAAPEFRFYLNDLPTNDFNTIFQALPDLYRELNAGKDEGCPPVYVAGFPGTFYGRVFPDNCLHLVYSSYGLHWLSRVPLALYDGPNPNSSINKKSIYISGRSPVGVCEAYYKQFQDDFSLFLKSRSQELINGGKMVLILLGRDGPFHVDRGISFLWEILYQSLATLVDQGDIEEGRLESYEVNFYAPSKEELEDEVRREGCFKIEAIEKFEMDRNWSSNISYGNAVAKAVRSIQEPMIAHHFGYGILDKLFQLYGRLVDQEMAKEDISSTSIVLVLTKF